MSNLLFDLFKLLSKDDKLVLAAQTAEGIKMMAKGVAALSETDSNLQKSANLIAVLSGGAADWAQAELVGETAREKNMGRFLAGLSVVGQSGSVFLGSDNTLGRLARGTAAVSNLGTSFFVLHQVEKLTQPAGLLEEKAPRTLEPPTIDVVAERVEATTAPAAIPPRVIAPRPRRKRTNTGLRAAQAAATVAELGASLSQYKSATQKTLELSSAAGNAVGRAIMGKKFAGSDFEYKLALGANATETAGTVLEIFTSEGSKLRKIGGLARAVGGEISRIEQTAQLGRLIKTARSQAARSQRTAKRIPVVEGNILPPGGASD